MDNLEPLLLDILLILCAFAAGWVSATVKVWGLSRRTSELEYALEDLSGRVTREVKIRSGTAGQRQKQADAEIFDWAKEQVVTPPPRAGPELKPLHEWRRDRMSGGK